MDFRTEIGPVGHSFGITHDDGIVLLGSCFADNIGSLLADSGFDVVHNPGGPLYNPASLLYFLQGKESEPVLHDGVWHSLDMASRFQDTDRDRLMERVHAVREEFRRALDRASVLIVTFGTARIWTRADHIVANCHKLPDSQFRTVDLNVEEIEWEWTRALSDMDKKIIFTLSPVRYPSYGLAGDSLSKATLRVAIDRICRHVGADYFPAYEILTSDLRDYRFYADDMKHPSPLAVNYIYEIFRNTYFDEPTRRRGADCRRQARAAAHRPIIDDNETFTL